MTACFQLLSSSTTAREKENALQLLEEMAEEQDASIGAVALCNSISATQTLHPTINISEYANQHRPEGPNRYLPVLRRCASHHPLIYVCALTVDSSASNAARFAERAVPHVRTGALRRGAVSACTLSVVAHASGAKSVLSVLALPVSLNKLFGRCVVCAV